MVRVICSPKVELVILQDDYDLCRRVISDLPDRGYAFVSDLASVTEFLTATFYVECSRVASHQLVRHRLCSFVQRSQRYEDQEPILLLPRSVIEKVDLNLLVRIYEEYVRLRDVLKVPREYARYILSQCMLTRLLVRTNLRELAYIINIRACSRAQAETRYIAIRMMMLLYEHDLFKRYPELRNVFAPFCARYGYCKYRPQKRDVEKLRKCRERGYIEAFREHGTSEELEKMEEIVKLLP